MRADSNVALHTGNAMPVLGLGTWELTHDTTGTVLHALELGYRMIDTAADYGTQPGIGAALRQSGLDRDAVYVVAKVEEDEDAWQATRSNLAELGLDYADLVLIHRPPGRRAGVELWEGLVRAKADGLAKDIGVSNYRIEQIRELAEASGETPAVNQIEWSPFGYSTEMLDYCRRNGILIQAYSPLTRARRLRDEELAFIADTYGKSTAQLLIRWSLQLSTVPLPKANRPGHLAENIRVFDFDITAYDMARLSNLNEHYSSLTSLPYV